MLLETFELIFIILLDTYFFSKELGIRFRDGDILAGFLALPLTLTLDGSRILNTFFQQWYFACQNRLLEWLKFIHDLHNCVSR